MGSPGSGKTSALVTAIKAGLELVVVITDPGGEESLIDSLTRLNLPRTSLHTKYIAPAVPQWAAMRRNAERINIMSYKDLTELKADPDASDYRQFLELLDCLAHFKSDQGTVLGPVDMFPPERMLALDSASGLNLMALALMVGGKPAPHQGEWGVAMNAEEQLILKLCADTKCFFTMIAHLDREVDEVQGRTIKMAGLLGRKLAPKIARFFSDVILAYREGAKFYWSTASSDVDLKARNLPLREKLEPDFAPIIEAWRSRQGKPTTKGS
jgi:hypothetical protein